MRLALLTPLLVALALPAHATNRTDPADPKAPVPALQHRSVLARPAAPVADPAEPGRWRAAHEAVQRAGGWRAYAREPVHAAPAASAAKPHHHGAPQ
ncbi:hypothetical protein [Inhella sp.]|uniref:hypothetical protein n=1 Tax=Inhella sp. TaxID=1921806 RepID=UPI0035B3CC69